MGLTLTLTDKELPASPSFIEFMYHTLKGESQFTGDWFLQEEENLTVASDRFDRIQEMAHFVSEHDAGKQAILQSYRFFKELLTGNIDMLKRMQAYHFIFVIGIPRTGGTYLTKQLFRACDIDYKQVQSALAHDGFPHLARLSFKKGSNVHTNGLLQLAEFLTMVDVFYRQHSKARLKQRIVVPKKFTKAVFYFDLIKEVFGDNASYWITLRHPLGVCQSVLDKSGGLPEGGLFQVRSTIERWALEDWVYRGYQVEAVHKMDYIDVMLGYWKRFHLQMAMAGIPGLTSTELVPFTQQHMTAMSQSIFSLLGVSMEPEPFKVSQSPVFSEQRRQQAMGVLQEVAAFWKSLDLIFPVDDLHI